MSRANIREVARQAGVSIATVSYIINNKPCNVSQETRERVLRVVDELNYVPNSLARSIFKKTTNVIGFAFNYTAENVILDPFLSVAFLGVSEGARRHGQDLLLHTSLPTFEEMESMSAFLDNRIEGLLVLNPRRQDRLLNYLAGKGLPTVAICVDDAPQGIGYVGVDEQSGARKAVEHLIELGHRRIAHIRGPAVSMGAWAREQGYRAALEAAKIPFDPELVIPGSFHEAGGAKAAKTIARMNPRPTAILACNDRAAFGAIGEFRKAGLTVPEDISMVGFDDLPIPGTPADFLTTVHHPVRDIAKVAVETLVRIINGAPPSDCRIKFPAELVLRHSTRPPR